MAQIDTNFLIPADYPDDLYDECSGDCESCFDSACEEHPSQRWKWDLEYAEAEFCDFGSAGQYLAGYEYCEFVCPIRETCRIITKQSEEANDGKTANG